MRLRPRSVRTRLTLWHASVLTLIVCAFSVGIFFFVRVRLLDDLDARLARDVDTIEATYDDAPTELSEAETRAGIRLFQVVENGALLHRTEAWTQKKLDQAPLSGAAAISWSSPDGVTYRVLGAEYPTHRISVAADEHALRRTLWTLAVILALGIPFAMALAVAGGWFLAGRVLAPVGAMAERTRRITADSLGERLPVDDPEDEFGRLATVFNDTLARLQDAFERLRRFTADASHELRTPLTAMRSVGEVALHDSRDAAGYRDVIGSMLEEVERLTGLVESLLTLTRVDSSRLRVSREVVDLRSVASSATEHLRVLAEEKEQTLTVNAADEVRVQCDPMLLRQGIVNLVDNAIKYTPHRGTIRVDVKVLPSGDAAVEVRDDGPGIARAHHDRIFERFYRVDAGRSRSDGGLGLGLSIARSTVEASGGRIEVESEEGRGSIFRVVLAMAPMTPARPPSTRGAPTAGDRTPPGESHPPRSSL
jgi:heavy metal sensor kinase